MSTVNVSAEKPLTIKMAVIAAVSMLSGLLVIGAVSLYFISTTLDKAEPPQQPQGVAASPTVDTVPLALNPPSSQFVVPGTLVPSVIVEEDMTAAIKGPQKLRPGQMAAYRAGYNWSKSGVNLFTAANDFNNDPTEFNWQVAGRNGAIDISNFVSETGSSLFYAFEEPGLYTVTLIMGKVRQGRAVLRSTSLPVVVSATNAPPTDLPNTPDNPTVPQAPEMPLPPEAPQTPVQPLGLQSWVTRQAAALTPQAKLKKAAMAAAYKDGVAFINNQNSSQLEDDNTPYDFSVLVKWQQGRNRTELTDDEIPAWKPFFDTLALQLQTLMSKGKLKTKKDFVAAWTEIYLGLEQ